MYERELGILVLGFQLFYRLCWPWGGHTSDAQYGTRGGRGGADEMVRGPVMTCPWQGIV